MQSTIKYKYGFDEHHKIIDIEEVTEADRKDYQCISCSTILRPALGEKNAKHFRHKESGCESSLETYLHTAGKLLFEKTYNLCLVSKRPYMIEYWAHKSCNYCCYGPCQVSSMDRMVQIDLTKKYDRIIVETRDGKFIPDIILHSSTTDSKLYIEIAVSHSVSQEKAMSGSKIIEFSVKDEEGLKILNSDRISEAEGQVRFINIDLTIQGDYHGQCNTVNAFVVHLSGKSILKSFLKYTLDNLQKKGSYVEILGWRTSGLVYKDAVERAYFVGVKIINCFLCDKYVTKAKKKGVIFFINQKGSNTNDAVNCKYYKNRYDMPEDKFFCCVPPVEHDWNSFLKWLSTSAHQ